MAVFDFTSPSTIRSARRPNRGRSALESTWTTSHRPGRSSRFEPRRVVECGDEVAVDLANLGTIFCRSVHVDSIERIWHVDASGKVIAVHAYFEADATIDERLLPPQRACLMPAWQVQARANRATCWNSSSRNHPTRAGPTPNPGDRCRLGFPDVLMCRATYPLTPALPFIAGQEATGMVTAVG